MTGREFRTVASGTGPNDTGLFRTPDGKVYEIYTAYRTRSKFGAFTILESNEFPKLDADGYPITLSPIPEDLLKHLNCFLKNKYPKDYELENRQTNG